MKRILNIGHIAFLLPDGVDADPDGLDADDAAKLLRRSQPITEVTCK